MGYHLNADESPMNFSIALSASPFPLLSENIVFDLPILTKLSSVTLSERPGQCSAWTLQSVKESPFETLDLRSLSDRVLLKIDGFSLNNLQNVRLLHCTFSFAALCHPHITTLHLRTWNPISWIAGRRAAIHFFSVEGAGCDEGKNIAYRDH